MGNYCKLRKANQGLARCAVSPCLLTWTVLPAVAWVPSSVRAVMVHRYMPDGTGTPAPLGIGAGLAARVAKVEGVTGVI